MRYRLRSSACGFIIQFLKESIYFHFIKAKPFYAWKIDALFLPFPLKTITLAISAYLRLESSLYVAFLLLKSNYIYAEDVIEKMGANALPSHDFRYIMCYLLVSRFPPKIKWCLSCLFGIYLGFIHSHTQCRGIAIERARWLRAEECLWQWQTTFDINHYRYFSVAVYFVSKTKLSRVKNQNLGSMSIKRRLLLVEFCPFLSLNDL